MLETEWLWMMKATVTKVTAMTSGDDDDEFLRALPMLNDDYGDSDDE